MRAYCRSTRAHNTVTVDGRDQCDMWGIFRLGRRARPVEARLRVRDGCQVFQASHDGYRHLVGGLHRRTIVVFPQELFLVVDRVSGRGPHRMTSYLHFHPDCKFTTGASGPSEITVEVDGCRVAVRSALTGGEPAWEKGWYCPRFGIRRETRVLAVRHDGPLPATLAYCIGRVPAGPVRLDMRRAALTIGKQRFSWSDAMKANPCGS